MPDRLGRFGMTLIGFMASGSSTNAGPGRGAPLAAAYEAFHNVPASHTYSGRVVSKQLRA